MEKEDADIIRVTNYTTRDILRIAQNKLFISKKLFFVINLFNDYKKFTLSEFLF